MLNAIIVNNRTFLIVYHSGNGNPTRRTDRFRVHELEPTTSPASKHTEPYVRDWTYKVAKLWKCRYSEKTGTLSITGYGYCKMYALKETVIDLVNKGEL